MLDTRWENEQRHEPSNTGGTTHAIASSTAEGIGMGSTGKEVTAAFGQPATADKQGAKVEILRYPSAGAEFVLHDGKVTHMTFRQLRR